MTRNAPRGMRSAKVRNPDIRARVDPALHQRVKACVAEYNRRLPPGAPQADAGDIVRMGLIAGLPTVEAQLGITPPAEPASGEPAAPPAPAKRTAKKTAAKRAK